MVLEKQPRSEEEFKPLLDQLASQLVNLLSSEIQFSFLFFFSSVSIAYTYDSKLLERKTFSTISKHEYDVMCERLNLTTTGTIEFAEADVLFGDVLILDSCEQQIKLVSHVNVSGVRTLRH